MSGLKGGALLLLLGVPVALYAAWQVKGAAHVEADAPEVPADKSGSKEQLAAAGAKAGAWSAEARKAVEVSVQYRAAAPADNSPDANVAGVVKAASARAADLNDLDRFLSDVEKPEFTGKLKPRYDEWMLAQADLRIAAQAVADWLAGPPRVASADDADKAMTAVTKLIDAYATRSRFADKGKAATWKLRARVAVTDALATAADVQYRAAMGVKLPLKPGANEGTTAAATFKELKGQLALLAADLKQAEDDRLAVPAALRTAVEAKTAGADEYTAREELLGLFAKADLFTNPNGAAPWLKLVAAQYARTKDEKARALIRDKVQEFADAFVPPAARLDDEVILGKDMISRAVVVVKYEEKLGAGFVSKKLSADPNGLNEFELMRKPPGFNQRVTDGAKEYELKALRPTPASEAAVAFNAARAQVAARTAAPRWTPETVAALKKTCEAQKELVDQLRLPGAGAAGPAPQIATRVAGLVAGMSAAKELFEAGP